MCFEQGKIVEMDIKNKGLRLFASKFLAVIMQL